MSSPRTSKEALIAEMLGDLDTLLARAEELPDSISAAEEKILGTIAALNDAGEKYRIAVTAFTNQAKAELSDYLDLKTTEASEKMIEEQRKIIHQAALNTINTLNNKQPNTYFEKTVKIILTACLTALLVFALLKIS